MGFSGSSNFALFTEQVDATIVRAMQPKIVYDQLSRRVGVTKGNVREYNQTTTDFPVSMTKVSEGGEFDAEVVEFDRQVVAFNEVGAAPRISKRQIEDGEWDIIQITLEEIGFAAARTVNRDCLEAVRANVPSSSPNNVVTATAAWSAATADPLRDISLAKEKLEQKNYGDGKKFLIINPNPAAYLRLDPNVSRVMYYGDATVLKGNILPQLYDVNILSTTDLASATGWTSLASTFGLLVNADYAINYYERQALSTEQVEVPKGRAVDVIAYMRYAFAVIRPNATSRISTIA